MNLRVSRAEATKKPTITMTISDESHWSMSQRWLLLFHWHTPWQKCLDWLVGTAAPHPKWRLHSFPSGSLILVQLSGTFTKRWNPAAKFCKILCLWRDSYLSTNQSWITRYRCAAVKSFNYIEVKSYLRFTGCDGRKWYVVTIVETAALLLQSCLHDAQVVVNCRKPALRNIKLLVGSGGWDFFI